MIEFGYDVECSSVYVTEKGWCLFIAFKIERIWVQIVLYLDLDSDVLDGSIDSESTNLTLIEQLRKMRLDKSAVNCDSEVPVGMDDDGLNLDAEGKY